MVWAALSCLFWMIHNILNTQLFVQGTSLLHRASLALYVSAGLHTELTEAATKTFSVSLHVCNQHIHTCMNM